MDTKKSPFLERSIAVVNDLSVDEQFYLYRKTAELKQAIFERKDLSSFKLNNPELGVYLMFLEDSTRTKESFRNAAYFHKIKLNNFDSAHSSVNKKESLTDTVKMLTGYSFHSLFIIRSRMEGVCRHLERQIGEYAKAHGLSAPSFINAGDGRHEHPTQEFLDEFSFLEKLNWNRDHIHLALVGDLFHGRTVHSKVNGLRIFKNVEVDLIAPQDLKLPDYYESAMKRNGFEVRRFSSIREYLAQKKIAPLWYFTRLQLERMGDKIRDRVDYLRESVSFKREFISRVPEGSSFFHPLPRHREVPTIPSFLDNSSLNAWDEQSRNGFYTRIVLIAMLGGHFGDDFDGQGLEEKSYDQEFIRSVEVKVKQVPEYKVGIKPVESGIVIDHIAVGEELQVIWNRINKIRKNLDLNVSASHGVYPSGKSGKFKGLISIPDFRKFNQGKLRMLAAISPGCTLNVVDKRQVVEKYRIAMPPRIYNFQQISCKNEACISSSKYYENVVQEFIRSGESGFSCCYCEKEHTFNDIWDE